MVKRNILELTLAEVVSIGPDFKELLRRLERGDFELIEVDEEDLPPVPDDSPPNDLVNVL